MNRYYSFLLALVLSCIGICWAQKGANVYLFEEFKDATVHFKDGTYTKEKINYDIARSQFAFLTKDTGEIQNVTDANDILIIKIENRTFYPEKAGGVEILSMAPAIYVQYKATSRVEAPKGAYGLTSETTSIRTYGGFNADGRRYELGAQHVEIVKRYNIYWIEKGNRKKMFKNFNQFMKLYPKHKADIAAYIKENNIDFEDVDMIVKLCVFAESL